MIRGLFGIGKLAHQHFAVNTFFVNFFVFPNTLA
jgi:hypothetical protein